MTPAKIMLAEGTSGVSMDKMHITTLRLSSIREVFLSLRWSRPMLEKHSVELHLTKRKVTPSDWQRMSLAILSTLVRLSPPSFVSQRINNWELPTPSMGGDKIWINSAHFKRWSLTDRYLLPPFHQGLAFSPVKLVGQTSKELIRNYSTPKSDISVVFVFKGGKFLGTATLNPHTCRLILWAFDNGYFQSKILHFFRRMFPTLKTTVSGLSPEKKYYILLDLTLADDCRYKYTGKEWVVAGKSEPQVPGRFFIHPDSPATGTQWMKHDISFQKVKLTNNNLDQNGHVSPTFRLKFTHAKEFS